MARVILRRLKFDNETIKRVCLLVRYHDDRPAVTPRNVRRAISRIGVENYGGSVCGKACRYTGAEHV